jgi:hypothetical protein
MFIHRFISRALLLAGVAAAPQPAAHLHRPVQAGALRKLIVLPAAASVTKLGIKGGSPLVEESRQLEKSLEGAASDVLEAKGCTVLPGPFAAQTQASDEELTYSLADLQKSFDLLHPKMRKKSKDVAQGRFSLGDQVSKANPDGEADALLFIRGQGLLNTGGQKAFDVVAGGLLGILYAEDRMALQAAVVDARTGVVIEYGHHSATGNFLKKDDAVVKSIRETLSHFSCAQGNMPPDGKTGVF